MTGLLLVMQARPKVSEEKSGVWNSWVFLFTRVKRAAYCRRSAEQCLANRKTGYACFFCLGDTMKILKVINNNVVSALDKDAEEVVIMGKGIGFHAKPGQIVEEEKVEKIFRLEDEKSAGQFAELMKRLPVEYLKVSDEIITYAKNDMKLELNPSIYLTLTDHISFAIERYRGGMIYGNPLMNEVKTFYQEEYQVGEFALKLIEEKLGVKLDKDEAASVALHVVNAEYNTGVRNTMNIACLIRDVVDIVREYFNIELQEESLHYARFITHLKFLGQRIFTGQMLGENDGKFGKLISSMYPVEYACSEKIAHYIKVHYNQEITDEEAAYLAVHIRRIQPEDMADAEPY